MNFLPAEQGEHFKVNLYDHGCGVAVGDFDGDGHEDVYFVNQLGPNALYRNKGDGTFEDVTRKAGVALGDRICVAATFADYDNDGHADLYVTSTRGGNVLFHNNGDGTFHDVTQEAGLSLARHSQTAAFFDYDNDGWLDLFVINTAEWTLNTYDRVSHYFPSLPSFGEMAGSRREANVLYHNNRDGTFTDVTLKAGVAGNAYGMGAAVGDYDRDGWPDLYVTQYPRSILYHNNGDGTFTDVTAKAGVAAPGWATSAVWFDYDNDGWLDLFVCNYVTWSPAEDLRLGYTRDGKIVIVNSLGAGLIEARAMLAFLPALAPTVLGAELKMPNVATWWLGRVDVREELLDKLDSMVIAASVPSGLLSKSRTSSSPACSCLRRSQPIAASIWAKVFRQGWCTA